ncbi:hypothetical protein NQ318_020935, partial [Aromia moschata]
YINNVLLLYVGPQESFRKVLGKISEQGIEEEVLFNYLNAFVKLTLHYEDNLEKIGYRTEDLLCCLRISLTHESTQIRTSGLRCIRHVLKNESDIIQLNKLLIPYLLSRTRYKSVLDLLYELLGLPQPEWSDEVSVALSAVDPCEPQASWRLNEGFVVAEGRSVLPHLAKTTPSTTDMHLALLLYCFLENGLLGALTEVIATSDTFISVRATVLLGELLRLIQILLPPGCCNVSPSLPTLLEYATKSKPQAIAAITALQQLHKLMKRRPASYSLHLDYIIRSSYHKRLEHKLEKNVRHKHSNVLKTKLHQVTNNIGDIIKSARCESDDDIMKLKASVWSVGHMGSSNRGHNYLNSFGVIDNIINLATRSPVYSIRATAFFALGQLATTPLGANDLSRKGWLCTRHNRHEYWPIIKEDHEESIYLNNCSMSTSDDVTSLDNPFAYDFENIDEDGVEQNESQDFLRSPICSPVMDSSYTSVFHENFEIDTPAAHEDKQYMGICLPRTLSDLFPSQEEILKETFIFPESVSGEDQCGDDTNNLRFQNHFRENCFYCSQFGDDEILEGDVNGYLLMILMNSKTKYDQA